MSWFNKEKVIREKRTLEAVKKNMMGPSGKLGIIVKSLGSPIIRQGSNLYDSTSLEDPYDLPIDVDYETTASGQLGPEMFRDEILESDDYVEEQGYVFDGLSRGMHLEIQYWYDNQYIKTTYKGFLVYKEVAGELFSYAPFPDWEKLIEQLYKTAKSKAKVIKQVQEAKLGKQLQKEKQNFWTKLRDRWGI